MAPRAVTAALAALLLLLAAGPSAGAEEADEGWRRDVREKTGLDVPLRGDFRLERERTGSGETVLEFSCGGDFLRIRVLTDVEERRAVAMLDDRVFLIENLFLVQPSPYADVLSQVVGVAREEGPARCDWSDDRRFGTGYRLYANGLRVYGGTVAADNTLVSAYAMLYDRTRSRFYELKYFTSRAAPSNDPEAFLAALMRPAD